MFRGRRTGTGCSKQILVKLFMISSCCRNTVLRECDTSRVCEAEGETRPLIREMPSITEVTFGDWPVSHLGSCPYIMHRAVVPGAAHHAGFLDGTRGCPRLLIASKAAA